MHASDHADAAEPVMLSVRIPDDLRKRLKRLALERNVTMAATVEHAILSELDRLELADAT